MASGAVFGDQLIVENLMDYISVVPRQNAKDRSPLDDAIYRVAKLFRALKECLKDLDEYYVKVIADLPLSRTPVLGTRLSTSLTVPTHHTPSFIGPHFTTYHDRTSGKAFTLTYKKRLVPHHSNKALFVAEATGAPDTPSENVVVKFAYRYNGEAHASLAASLLAPRLRYCNFEPSMGLYVVVMDYLEGAEMWDRSKLLPVHVDSLRTAVKILHDQGFVFGDLRSPNVLVEGDRAVLIDFDWCGKEGEVRYPSDILLEKAQWHPDVMQGGLIMQEHDSFQFYHLTGTEFYVTEPVE